MDNNTIGNVILRERQAKKLSQEVVSSFADALGTTPSVLMAKIEEEMAKNES